MRVRASPGYEEHARRGAVQLFPGTARSNERPACYAIRSPSRISRPPFSSDQRKLKWRQWAEARFQNCRGWKRGFAIYLSFTMAKPSCFVECEHNNLYDRSLSFGYIPRTGPADETCGP